MKIALVDDDALYREVLADDLADRGFTVIGFGDGESLLIALRGGLAPRLVLLDWSLPTMSGLELLRRLRASGFDAPIVFLTGRSRGGREIEALDGGAIDFIDKAGGIDALAERLRRIVGLPS
jgi:two-component system response regulator ChvI